MRTDTYLISRITPSMLSDPVEPDGNTLGLIRLMKDIHAGGVTFSEALDRLP